MYNLMTYPTQHTCWDDPEWDGTMESESSDKCAGCAEAKQHPCQFCGYGHLFATHNPEAHAENGDDQVPYDPEEEWHVSPHIYV